MTCVLIPNVPAAQKCSVLGLQPKVRVWGHIARSGHQLGHCQGDSDHSSLQGLTQDDILSAKSWDERIPEQTIGRSSRTQPVLPGSIARGDTEPLGCPPPQTHRAREGGCSPRGCPSFSQEMWGVGCPSARHSSLTLPPSSTLCSLRSPALLIWGATAPRREGG